MYCCKLLHHNVHVTPICYVQCCLVLKHVQFMFTTYVYMFTTYVYMFTTYVYMFTTLLFLTRSYICICRIDSAVPERREQVSTACYEIVFVSC